MWVHEIPSKFLAAEIELQLEQVGSLVKGYLQILYPHRGSGELTGTIEGNKIVFSVPAYPVNDGRVGHGDNNQREGDVARLRQERWESSLLGYPVPIQIIRKLPGPLQCTMRGND